MLAFKIRNMPIYSLLLLGAFLLQNCNRSNINTPTSKQLDIPAKIIDSAKSDDNKNIDSTNMTFEVVFSEKPNKASIAATKLKYNKNGWVSGEWDDNAAAALQAFKILNNFYYTDGCGNKINYALASAVNGRHQFDNREFGLWEGLVTYTEMKNLIAHGWDIENHSYYHGDEGNYSFGNDWYKNIKELDDLIYERIGYRMNGAVVPTSYSGFPTAAKKFGYLFSSSQGTFDDMKPSGQPEWGKGYQDFDYAPEDFSAFGRLFYDDWAEMEKDFIKWCDDSFKYYNSYFRIGSHGIDEAAFIRMMNYFRDKSNDKFALLPTREIMEYRIMTKQPIESILTGNKLTVKVNLKNVPSRFRWKDLSFIITSEKSISQVKTINNIDKVTFNPGTGLINIFNQKVRF